VTVTTTAGEVLFSRDPCAARLGIELVESGWRRAVLRMEIRPDMLNGHGSAHGGMVFSLADTAFAMACNSEDEVTVAASASIEFVGSVAPGTVLTATAEGRHQGRRAGVYDIEVTDDEGRVVAFFRGRSHRIGGSFAGGGS
jgi:acyl-CoA thioesterase